MTEKRRRFVDEYLKDLNATQAAIRAGFSAKTAGAAGARLLKDVRIASEIEQKKQERSDEIRVDQQYVVRNLTEIVERCLERAPVMVRDGRNWVQKEDEDGNGVWEFDAQGAVKALALLAKHVGGFNDRVDLTVTDQRKAVEELAGILGVPVDQLPVAGLVS
jgi:phage terminase small subunit